jgi:3-oxoacyl-[acyl-carrier-protein] synthase-1
MTARPAPILVVGCGMTTAVGLTAPASCAAIRAGISGFRETRFMALGGTPIVGAEAPLGREARGLRRLAQLVAGPIRECLAVEPSLVTQTLPLLLSVAETTRPGRFSDLDISLLPMIQDVLNTRFHPSSRVIAMGRVAGAIAIREATKLVNDQGFRRVIIAGVDNYLIRATVEHFDDCNRLLTERNSNGFIPGEAGAALLVGADDGSAGLRVRSLGLAVEEAVIDSDRPLRGEGLAMAYRQALAAANLGLHEIDYRMGDCSGEQYWFKEVTFAVARLMRIRKEFQDFWCPADCLGETGAAAIPCMAGAAWWAARKGYAPGPLGLLHAANDDGRRVALVTDGASV